MGAMSAPAGLQGTLCPAACVQSMYPCDDALSSHEHERALATCTACHAHAHGAARSGWRLHITPPVWERVQGMCLWSAILFRHVESCPFSFLPLCTGAGSETRCYFTRFVPTLRLVSRHTIHEVSYTMAPSRRCVRLLAKLRRIEMSISGHIHHI